MHGYQEMKIFPDTWLNISAHETINEDTVDPKSTELRKLRHLDFVEL